MKRGFLAACVGIAVLAYASSAEATSCHIPAPEERIRQNPIIFKGKLVDQTPIEDPKKRSDGYNSAKVSSKFEISTVYKGDPGEILELTQMRDPWGDAGLQAGHEYIIFTNKNLKVYYCNPFIDLRYSKEHGGAYRFNQEIEALEKMKGDLDSHEATAKNEDDEESILAYGKALEGYHDFIRAEKVYAALLQRQSSGDKQKWKDAVTFDIGDKCDGKFAAGDASPAFLKGANYTFSAAALTSYGRVLVRQGRHQEALRPLCLSDEGLGDKEAKNHKILSLFQTGGKGEISGGPYDLGGAQIGSLDVSGMNLAGWSFAGGAVSFKANGTVFDGVNFSGASINGEFSNTSFKGTNLQGARLRGKFDGADFSNANLKNAQISGEPLRNIKFIQANLAEAKMYADTANDIDFTGADMTKISISEYFGGRSGQNISLKNANLEAATLGGIRLEGIDFGTANIANANFNVRAPFGNKKATSFAGSDLSKVQGIGSAMFDGAVYDCKTIFPAGFAAQSFLKEQASADCAPAVAGPERFPDHEKERQKRHASTPNKGKVISENFVFEDGLNLDGARVTSYAKIPEGFDFSKYKLIPTSIINGKGSPWEFSHVGRTAGTCEVTIAEETSGYYPPKIPTPDLKGMDLSFLEFYSSWLPGVDMSGAQLMYSNFAGSNLIGASFTKADMEGIDLFNALLDKADLSKANLKKADLRLARLTDARLDGADLTDAIYDLNTMWPKGFDPVKAGARREAPRYPYGQPVVMFPNREPTPARETARYEKFKIAGLPADAVMYGVGIYGNANGHVFMNVSVNKKDAPLVLVLNSGYSATINVSAAPEAKLAAIIVTNGDVGNMPEGVKVYDYNTLSTGAATHVYNKCGRRFDRFQDLLQLVTGLTFTKYLTDRFDAVRDDGDDNAVEFVIKD